MKILIVGAGVGGLAAARYLVAAGHDVNVFEFAPRLRTEGASLILWPNGTGILNDVGIDVDQLGFRMDALDTLSPTGATLMQLKLTKLARSLGGPTQVIPRGDLIERLADGLPDGCLQFNRRCTGIENEGGNGRPAVITFGDGSTAEGDIVIGADGHRSIVRKHLHGDDPAAYTGLATWYGMTKAPIEFGERARGLALHGKPGFCTVFSAGDDLLQWVFVTPWTNGDKVVRGNDAEKSVANGTVGEASSLDALRARFGGYAHPIPELLDAIAPDEVSMYPHILHNVPDVWGRGRVSMMGDAVHAVPPTLAQGVNQTLEDAWMINRVLTSGSGDVEAQLRSYEQTRAKRLKWLHRIADRSERRPAPPAFMRIAPYTAMNQWTIRSLSDYLRASR